MDIYSLLRALWRFKITSLLIIVLTLAAGAAIVKITPPMYVGASSYLLIAPPSPPTDIQLKADPSLRQEHYDNPFLRYGNTGVIVDVVAQAVSSQEEQQSIVAAGGDPNYTVSQRLTLGVASPIIDISVSTKSQALVNKTLDLVSAAMLKELHNVQASEHVDEQWMFTTRLIERPKAASRIYHGTLRALVGVLGAGVIILVVMLALRMTLSASRESKNPGPGGLNPADKSTRETDGPDPKSLSRRGRHEDAPVTRARAG